MLNWLFSSFTYFPNFIIWLPSFSSSWLIQLTYLSATWPFPLSVDLWIFFHSVKRVSNPRIFCGIIFVSDRTLVILIRMLYCTAFFKAKHFVFLFFLSFLWFISGEGISLGVIFPRGEFSQRTIFSGETFLGVIFTWRSLIRNRELAKNKKENYNPAHKILGFINFSKSN